MKRLIIIVMAIGMVAFGGYQGYVQLAKMEKQRRIDYYNDASNFEEYAIGNAEGFRLEDYHVTEPSYRNEDEITLKLKNDLESMFPKGSDCRGLIYVLTSQNMHNRYGELLNYKSLKDQNGNYVRNEKGLIIPTTELAFKNIGYTKILKFNGIEKNPWHYYSIQFNCDHDFKTTGFLHVTVTAGETKSKSYKSAI